MTIYKIYLPFMGLVGWIKKNDNCYFFETKSPTAIVFESKTEDEALRELKNRYQNFKIFKIIEIEKA